MRLALALATILLSVTPAWAERYALVGPDDVVITVIDNDGYPVDISLPVGGYVVLVTSGSAAETGGSYKNGTFSPRPKTPQEILVERMTLAIELNKSFIAIGSPTSDQQTEQIRRLTQQVTAILQYQLQRFEGVVQ